MGKRRQRIQTRRKQRRIGEGQFGFVVSPAIPCEGKNVSRKVSKVFKSRNALKPNYQAKYKSFNVRKTELIPVVEKLLEIDPSQSMYIYPEFCDSPGPLTNELRANGVSNNSKQSSYLMMLGGQSYHQVFGDFFNVLTSAFMAKDDMTRLLSDGATRNISKLSYSSANYKTKVAEITQTAEKHIETIKTLAKSKERAELLFAKLKPLVQRIEKIVQTLHEAGIVHRDLHDGNVVLEWTDEHIDAWVKQVNAVIQSIRESEKYREWATLVGAKNFIGYRMDFTQMMTCLKLIDDMGPLDLSKITPKIIDWDSAHIITSEDDKEDAEEEFGELLGHLLPSSGPFWWFSERYDDS